MDNWPEWLEHTVAIGLGLLVLGLIFWKFRDEIFFKFRAIAVEGRITNWMSMKDKGVTFYYPLIEFHDLNGNVVNYRANERCEGRPMYPVGTKVVVRYDKKNPKKVKTEYPEKS